MIIFVFFGRENEWKVYIHENEFSKKNYWGVSMSLDSVEDISSACFPLIPEKLLMMKVAFI